MAPTKKERMKLVAGIVAFCAGRTPGGDPECALMEALADMTLWCEAHGFDIDNLLGRAQQMLDDMPEAFE